jgi:hypothetical protein
MLNFFNQLTIVSTGQYQMYVDYESQRFNMLDEGGPIVFWSPPCLSIKTM